MNMEKIDLIELIKDCPQGMELDCTMYDNVTLDSVSIENHYPIKIVTKNGFSTRLTKYGQNIGLEEAKCVIFPKGKTTWEGFVPPFKFKDGDVIFKQNFIAIISYIESSGRIWYHCWYNKKYKECKIKTDCGIGCINDGDEIRFATEEEKQKLFQAIKDNGYKWNAETKTLETLVKPTFKVGDRIRSRKNCGIHISNVIITEVGRCGYHGVIGDTTNKAYISFKYQDYYELIPNKFDINTLKPFESRVLVRDYNSEKWRVSFWGCLVDNNEEFKYDTVRGNYKQCIPYEGNEHLLGKTNDCNYFYKTWE